jgi:hypothetical protein
VVKDARENTHRLTDYAKLVSQKVDPVTAATSAFGDLKQLQPTLQKYVAQGTFYQFNLRRHFPLMSTKQPSR